MAAGTAANAISATIAAAIERIWMRFIGTLYLLFLTKGAGGVTDFW
jgi:hypothetical protein